MRQFTLHPLHHPPDEMTLISVVPMRLPSDPQASVIRASTSISPAFNTRMLDIYRLVTACDQPNFRCVCLPLPSNFDFHEWAAIAHTQVDHEVLQYLKYGFPSGFEGPIPTASFGNHSSSINHPRDVKV